MLTVEDFPLIVFLDSNFSFPFTECDQISPSFNKGYEEGFAEYQRNVRKQKFDEEKSADRKEAIERILSDYNNERCTASYDCRKDGECRFSKCKHNNAACTFDRDCKIEGRCSKESNYVSSLNEWVSVNVCKY